MVKRFVPGQRPVKRGRGRPELYKPEFARMAELHCQLGATDENLADLFNVGTTAIRNWMGRYKEFREAITRGKQDVFNPQVARSLAQRAIGYAVDTEEAKLDRNGQVVRYNVRKQYPPDVTACIFWLKNRDPEQWKDVRDHIIQHNNLDKLSSKELLAEIKKEAAELGIMMPDTVGVVSNNNGSTKH